MLHNQSAGYLQQKHQCSGRIPLDRVRPLGCGAYSVGEEGPDQVSRSLWSLERNPVVLAAFYQSVTPTTCPFSRRKSLYASTPHRWFFHSLCIFLCLYSSYPSSKVKSRYLDRLYRAMWTADSQGGERGPMTGFYAEWSQSRALVATLSLIQG